MFKRAAVHYGKALEPVTDHQKAAKAWDDRMGSYRVQAKNWRLAFFAQQPLIVGLAAGLIWATARGSIVPWVVEVDKLGRAEVVAPAKAGYRPTDPEIAYDLAEFIDDVRSLPADPVIARQDWLKAYDFTTLDGARALNEYARASDPLANIGKVQVSVDVSSVIRASPTSFRVAWTERRYQDGGLASTERWSAILTIALQPPAEPDALKKNPLGVYVTAINWSKELAS